MAIAEEVNLLLAVLHKGFRVGAFCGRLLGGGYRIKYSIICHQMPQCSGPSSMGLNRFYMSARAAHNALCTLT
jgi:hypothetical protein